MLKKIVLALVALVAVLVLVVAMQPADFNVQRSATMAATPETVFSQVNDFHNWEAWSPWAKLDPNSKMTFEGPTSGEGAICKWAGNSEVGEGMMTITQSKPSELVKIKLQFIKPFEGTNQTEFIFTPEGDDTKVTWTMTGHNDFVSKAFCLVMNGKEMIAKDFDKGLANIKSVVEKPTSKEEQPATTTEAAAKPAKSVGDADAANASASTDKTESANAAGEPVTAAAAKDAEINEAAAGQAAPAAASPATTDEAK